MFNIFKKKQEKKSDFELEDDEDDQPDSGYVQSLQLHLSRMIVYAESADPKLQREVSCSSIVWMEGVIDIEDHTIHKWTEDTSALPPAILIISSCIIYLPYRKFLSIDSLFDQQLA